MSTPIFESELILDCNEAIAWAAISAGVDLVAHYPGSPVNFAEKHIKKLNDRFKRGVKFNDALNEHVAALAAAGASYCGARSMVIMKHVGLNIAADPFNYIGYTGVKGGMVIIVGTDPGANSSTGEEDVHWFVPQFNFPLFEPTSVQECYDYTIEAYTLSEKHEIPVLIFVPGRLAYNFSNIKVKVDPKTAGRPFHFQKDRDKYINVGQRAVKNHRLLLEKIDRIAAAEMPYFKTHFNPAAKTGILVRGLGYRMTCELVSRLGLAEHVHLLNVDLVYPLNKDLVTGFCANKETIVFIEDQDGFLENQVKMNFFNELDCTVYGKDIFPKYGELQLAQVEHFFARHFGLKLVPSETIESPQIPERLGTFCEGCPHTGSYFSIDSVLKELDGVIGGDIGCSSLPPFRADWLLCMNAGIGVSQGMAQVLTDQPVVSTGGDGSFFHAGLLSLLNAVHNKLDFIHLIFDNSSIAMTGHQASPGAGSFDFRKLLEAIGVDKVIEVSPYKPNHFIEQLKTELDGKGVRVFWVRGECVISGNPYIESRRKVLYPEIDPTKCNGCSKCYKELACPAIINLADAPGQELKIDLSRCVRCGVCHEICPNDAIKINAVGS
jgi:indolepyruvate ferredoxin oxidoreductase, alpha subunit